MLIDISLCSSPGTADRLANGRNNTTRSRDGSNKLYCGVLWFTGHTDSQISTNMQLRVRRPQPVNLLLVGERQIVNASIHVERLQAGIPTVHVHVIIRFGWRRCAVLLA